MLSEFNFSQHWFFDLNSFYLNIHLVAQYPVQMPPEILICQIVIQLVSISIIVIISVMSSFLYLTIELMSFWGYMQPMLLQKHKFELSERFVWVTVLIQIDLFWNMLQICFRMLPTSLSRARVRSLHAHQRDINTNTYFCQRDSILNLACAFDFLSKFF